MDTGATFTLPAEFIGWVFTFSGVFMAVGRKSKRLKLTGRVLLVIGVPMLLAGLFLL